MSTASVSPPASSPSWLGHPNGLFLLFFVEMWERFSYYGMRALLIFYMTKGFLHLDDKSAYAIYGAYTALVYATPFIGGMLADKLLGHRRAVVFGGLLMAAGHLLMTIEGKTAFYVALALLICGNGFFKPNISTMIGALYPQGDPRRDGGFTIFYMGINLGAAMSPLICGYVGETFGWHYGFGLATIGMLSGLMTFVAKRWLSQILIGLTAFTTAGSMVWFHFGDPVQLVVNAPIGIALVVAAIIAIGALQRAGLPDDVGQPRDVSRLSKPAIAALPWLRADVAVYLGTALAVPIAALLLQNTQVAGVLLGVFGGGALLTLLVDAIRAKKVERERIFVVLILTMFSMLFFAFFEQAGSSLSNFTDRNVNRIVGGRRLTKADVGKTFDRLPISSALLGRDVSGHVWNIKMVDAAQVAGRDVVVNSPDTMSKADLQAAVNKAAVAAVEALADHGEKPTKESSANTGDVSPDWRVKIQRALLAREIQPTLESVEATESMVGMLVDGREVKASIFQAVNPIAIIVLGLPLSILWIFLARRGREPNTAIKFALGLFQLGLGFGAFWMGTVTCSTFGIVGMWWLLLGYILHTSGELCLSPVGLSMVTKLSPARMVSTVMGAWFLASGVSNYLAGLIASLTGVGHGESGKFPLPIETVHVYGVVSAYIAIAGCACGVLLLVISPLLVRWMHEGVEVEE